MDFSLQTSIRACRELTSRSNSNFVPAFRVLPGPKREAMEILYAFNRFTDDLADAPESAKRPVADRNAALADWSEALRTANTLSGAEDVAGFTDLARRLPQCTGIILLPAVRMILDRFEIPIEALFQVIDGVASDIEPQRFETFDDAADYCHMVATSVGVASLAIWGTTKPLFSPEVVKAAKACGIAFQWTNILRDLVEDFRVGRLYLPLEDLASAGLTESQLGSLLDRAGWNAMKKSPGNTTGNTVGISEAGGYNRFAHAEQVRRMNEFEEKFDRFLGRQIMRCSNHFQSAAALESLLERDGRRVFNRMFGVYSRLFAKIAARPTRILSGRVRLSMLEKVAVAVLGR